MGDYHNGIEWVREPELFDYLSDMLDRRNTKWNEYRSKIIVAMKDGSNIEDYFDNRPWNPRSECCQYLDTLIGVAIEHEYDGDDLRFFELYFSEVDMPASYKKAALRACEIMLEKQRIDFLERF